MQSISRRYKNTAALVVLIDKEKVKEEYSLTQRKKLCQRTNFFVKTNRNFFRIASCSN